MPSQVLWMIDNETDAKSFERLCVDLLYRTGYREIVPVQPQDGGRDAEEHPRRGRGREGEATFFQFSSEQDWKAKIRRDAAKLKRAGFDFSTLVFVTTRNPPGIAVDALKKEFTRKYEWDLMIYGREWLRLQLEEVHPDLAKKYFGLEAPVWSSRLTARMHFNKPTDARLTAAWQAFNAELFDRAAVEFREFLHESPDAASDVWQALAWCLYRSYRYDEALASINRALGIETTTQAQSIQACILVEKGIRNSDKSSLLEGRKTLEQVIAASPHPDWPSYYDLGNVESALGNHPKAIELYRRALQVHPREPQVWKNLATAYHRIGDHEIEMQCLDEVLLIDPGKFEALVSKGTSLMIDFNQPEEACALLEKALMSGQEHAVRWPHIWYWVAEAHHRKGDSTQALKRVEEGLAHQPGHTAMKRLKSDLLFDLAGKDPAMVANARQYWRSRLLEEARDYTTRGRLARLEAANDNVDIAWSLIDECFVLVDSGGAVPLRGAGFDIEQCIVALRFLPQYRLFRKRCPVADYWRRDDPLYDLPFAPLGGEEAQVALSTYLAVPFGVGYGALENVGGDRHTPSVLRNHAETLRSLVARAITQTARRFAPLIPPRKSGPTAVTGAVANILLFLGRIALRDFARQRGWIWSQFRISSKVVDATLQGFDESRIQADVASDTVMALDEESQFLSGSGPPSEGKAGPRAE
jgi:tetratricopeptide (TPR) repeat protein